MKLEVEKVAAQRSFLFLWCGSHEGLNEGRKVKRLKFRSKHQLLNPPINFINSVYNVQILPRLRAKLTLLNFYNFLETINL